MGAVWRPRRETWQDLAERRERVLAKWGSLAMDWMERFMGAPRLARCMELFQRAPSSRSALRARKGTMESLMAWDEPGSTT